MDFSRHIKPLTGETDWPMWKRKILDLLDYHEEAIEVIDGKTKRPESIDADAQESPLTGETDWPMWKREILDLLDYHEEAIEVIDGKTKRPESIDADAQESVKRTS
ncbi:hypothetical protein TNCV_4059531 [Trichonephila clavipes]|nr:hypothetical protein TNCV_4059531 [Trichonephila clavipes]